MTSYLRLSNEEIEFLMKQALLQFHGKSSPNGERMIGLGLEDLKELTLADLPDTKGMEIDLLGSEFYRILKSAKIPRKPQEAYVKPSFMFRRQFRKMFGSHPKGFITLRGIWINEKEASIEEAQKIGGRGRDFFRSAGYANLLVAENKWVRDQLREAVDRGDRYSLVCRVCYPNGTLYEDRTPQILSSLAMVIPRMQPENRLHLRQIELALPYLGNIGKEPGLAKEID